MKRFIHIVLACVFIVSCSERKNETAFTLKGDLKNTPDQKIYLEQLYFSQKDPDILDTADIRNGKFELSAIAAEEGLFRIRLEKAEHGFIFVNDKPEISFTADIKDVSMEGTVFNTRANSLLKKFLIDLKTKNDALSEASDGINKLKTMTGNDSLIAVETERLNQMATGFRDYIIKFIDTASDPVVAMFALGYTRNMDPILLKEVVPNLEKRFPKHQAVASLVRQFNQFIKEQNEPQQTASGLKVGSMAPEISLHDINGKTLSLSSLKGKYVLVDFWASWCSPCRAENPNVVAAYNKFKDKNFTILGVSFDDNKEDWKEAVKSDGLVWPQVSDLKGFDESPIAISYGIEAIPFNVLVDPQGKIIALSLRGRALEYKLSETLK